MKGRSLIALTVLSVALACQDDKLPTGPAAPTRVSSAVSDGSHGDNADFFFLPPLVKLKKNPDFVVGTFNNTLQPRLTIEICQLNTTVTPTDFTECVTGAPVKSFAPGEVNLVNLPSGKKDVPKHFKFEEWWKGGHLAADGFYYVMWDTRQPGLTPLNNDKFYRIKVILKGSTTADDFLLGFADVDPKPKEGPKWKYSRTRDLIEMVDGVMLPIPFRVENIGGHCSSADFCTQQTVDNGDNDPTTFQFVRVEGGAGAIAGARFPDHWLPAGGPDHVVVTIFEIPSDEAADGTRTTPCHAGLPLQQFNKCFRFTTTPVLATDKNGDQFAEFVRVAVCYTLENGDDRRKNFAEIWASGPNEETRPLPDVDDAGILGAGARGCEVSEVGLESSNPLIRLASSGWRMLKRGLSQTFGVKTAYAVDQGLGGIIKGFTNIGAALTARIEAYPNPTGGNHLLPLSFGVATARVKIVGSHTHAGEGAYAPEGINDVAVTFTLAPGNGSLFDGEGSGLEVTRMTTSINGEGESTVEGIASVQWTPPNTPGTYRLTASGPTTNGPITFTARVTTTLVPDLIVSSGAPVLGPSEVGTGGGVVGISSYTITNQGSAFVLDGSVSAGVYLSTDPTITASDTRITGRSIGSAFGAGSSFNAPAEEISIPERQAGLYYLGVLADEQNVVGESNEANNYASTPLLISDVIDFETYPNESGVCDGVDSCDVTDEFGGLGVVFSFDPLLPGESNASLCRKPFNPVGESPNYGVSPHATVGCSTWNSGTVTMSFGSRPKAVEFQLQGNDALSAGPFPVSALDANGNAVTVTRESVVTYSPSTGLTFRREIRRAISPVGIASVSVVSNAGVVFIDNLLIAP